ncbi:hypothetical protein BML2537_06540 [Providencia stuartii]|nr:hypothetical protein BML2537_06540 [Providencia stuartii]
MPMKHRNSKGFFLLFLTSMWAIVIFAMGVFSFFFAESYTWLLMNTEFTFSFEYIKKACKLALVLSPMLGVVTYFMYNS